MFIIVYYSVPIPRNLPCSQKFLVVPIVNCRSKFKLSNYCSIFVNTRWKFELS